MRNESGQKQKENLPWHTAKDAVTGGKKKKKKEKAIPENNLILKRDTKCTN